MIKTANIDVGGMLSALSVQGVEKRLRGLPGMQRAEVNYVAGSATVSYDDKAIDLAHIKEAVRHCGYHCTGELVPEHVCKPEDPPGEAIVAAAPASAAQAHASHAGHAGHTVPAGAAEHAAHAGAAAETAHEMGHGHGMDLQAMARDMRNRFWVAFVFAVPVFLYSPMGGMFVQLQPPLGLTPNQWLFLLASGAILYPGWPFYVAAVRALRNGVLNMAVLVLLSVGTGYLFSVGATFLFEGEQFYEAAAVLLVFILLGHWLEMRARAGASDAIRALMKLAPPMATVLRDGREVEVPTVEV